MVKYLICFCVGASTGYFISSALSTSIDISGKTSSVQGITTPSVEVDMEVVRTHITTAAMQHSSPKNTLSLKEKETTNQASSSSKTTIHLTPAEHVKLAQKIKALQLKNQTLENEYQRTNNRMMELTLELESLDESVISDQQMMTLKNDDFATYRRQFRGKQRDNIFELHKDQEDVDWGFEMSTQLRDFIETHYHANSVSVQGITCKVNRCELLILEREEGIWPLVSKELTQQTWWKFTSMHSSSSSTDDEKKSFYLFLSS